MTNNGADAQDMAITFSAPPGLTFSSVEKTPGATWKTAAVGASGVVSRRLPLFRADDDFGVLVDYRAGADLAADTPAPSNINITAGGV